MAYGDVLVALADPTRRRVFEAVRQGPAAVGELALGLPVTRPAVSQHLKVLERAGLVSARPAGNRRIYSIRPEGLAELRGYLEGLWTDVLGAYGNEIARRAHDEREENP